MNAVNSTQNLITTYFQSLSILFALKRCFGLQRKSVEISVQFLDLEIQPWARDS
jgi:hypothetical protein